MTDKDDPGGYKYNHQLTMPQLLMQFSHILIFIYIQGLCVQQLASHNNIQGPKSFHLTIGLPLCHTTSSQNQKLKNIKEHACGILIIAKFWHIHGFKQVGEISISISNLENKVPSSVSKQKM